MLATEEIGKLQALIKEAQFHKKIGSSGLGNVYTVTHAQYGMCVLKLLEGKVAQNPKFLKKFLQPASEIAKIRHTNIAAIYEISEDHPFFIIREEAPGTSLQQAIDNGLTFSPAAATQIMLQLANGLDAAYSLGVVHKNLKPDNLIIDAQHHLKIVDFSLPPTAPYYLSPEQCEGKKSDIRSDIYAFGAIYYFCLVGEPLYAQGTPKEIMEAHAKSSLPDVGKRCQNMPAKLSELLRRLLAKKADDRPQSYQELLPVLQEILRNSGKAGATATIVSGTPAQIAISTATPPPIPASEGEKTIRLVEEMWEVDSARLQKFKQVAAEMGNRLKTINQTLALLDNVRESQDEATLFLDEMLRFITLKTGEFLRADRTMVFLLDEDRNELWSILEQDDKGAPLEIRIGMDEGVAGAVVKSKREVNIAFDFYSDARSESRRKIDEKTGYRTYTVLALPLLNRQGQLVAVIELLNRLKAGHDPLAPLAERIEEEGFNDRDSQLFEEFAPSMRLILESSQSFYKAIQRQRAAVALMAATQSLSKSNLDLEDTLNRVMDEAKRLMNADRVTLWLLDPHKDELWTKILMSDGNFKEVRMPKNSGFVGLAASSGEPLFIPFDLYEHPESGTAKKMDQITGYRTCSMLCLPLFNNNKELIGVTQLVNKRRQGEFAVYNPQDWPKAPDCWKASFQRSDLEFMKAFNIQAGVALQNAKLFDMIKQQEQMQRDILRSLTNGVISTDRGGRVVAANDSAKKLLGCQQDKHIEGKPIRELVCLQEGEFGVWLDSVLNASDEKAQRQYYPEQTLLPRDSQEQHSINLSLNSIADVSKAGQVSGALVVIDDISDEKRVKNLMYRYMTQEVAEKLLSTGSIRLGGQLKEVSVLFSDIRSYTALTEGMGAEEVVALLNEYFEEMVDAIFQNKGTLDKYIGDAIMAVFGAPLPLLDHAWYAMQTALDMRRRLKIFNESRLLAGKKAIRIGIGIHSDIVISGNIGSSKRMELTAIGDGVNLASRLEGTTKYYGCNIIVSEKTYRNYASQVHVRELDYITVKGKTEPVKIYELLGLQSEPLTPQIAQVTELYGKGRSFYEHREFAKALDEFQKVLLADPNDTPSRLHIERCGQFLQEPPAADWDGVWKLTEK
jgi:adenylate cyclase